MRNASSIRPPPSLGRRNRSPAFLAGVLLAFAVVLLPNRSRSAAVASDRASARPASRGEETFESLMDDAMTRMHRDMHVPPSGDPDRDFARMMIPHHQGAVDMALAELRFGRNERLRRLAQEIIVEQRDEIAVMRSILGNPPAAGRGSPHTSH